MKELPSLALIAALTALTALPVNHARACGRDFFLCDPSSLQPGLAPLLLPTFRWDREGGQDEFEFSTGIVHPLTSRIDFDGYLSFTDEQGGWETESIVPGFLFDLSPDMEKSPARFGLFTAYRWAVNGGDVDEFISANQLDARDQFESRFPIETNVTEELGLVFNLLNSIHESKARWGYAAGLRYEFREDIGRSIEAIGDFRQAASSRSSPIFGGNPPKESCSASAQVPGSQNARRILPSSRDSSLSSNEFPKWQRVKPLPRGKLNQNRNKNQTS